MNFKKKSNNNIERELIAVSKIRAINEFGHGFIDGAFEENGTKMVTVRYDRAGNAVESVSYTSDGSEEDVCLMKYDERGNVTEEHRSRGAEITLRSYKYDDDGRILEQRVASPLGSSKVNYTFDDEALTILEEWFDSRGMPDESYVSKLDTNGNIIERFCTRPGGTAYRLYTQKFDELGRVVEKYFFEPSGNIFKKLTFAYSDDGTLQSALIYHRPDAPDMMIRYTYERY